MTIQSGDIKILASKVMDDVPEGGGAAASALPLDLQLKSPSLQIEGRPLTQLSASVQRRWPAGHSDRLSAASAARGFLKFAARIYYPQNCTSVGLAQECGGRPT